MTADNIIRNTFEKAPHVTSAADPILSGTAFASYYTSYDGEKIFYKEWQAEKEKAVIQIAHGLGEMADYYEEFARIANRSHFTVYLNEARGHGRTGPVFNSENIMDQFEKDLLHLNNIIREKHINKPVFLVGHSMGTVIIQSILSDNKSQDNDKNQDNDIQRTWAGVLLSGIPYQENMEELINEVYMEISLYGEDAPSVTTFTKMFSNVNDSFSQEEGALAWLTGDGERRDYFLSLPYTNVSYSNRFYKDFLEKSLEVQEEGIFRYCDKSLPVYILGGQFDVVSKSGTYGEARAKEMEENGFTNVKVKTYQGFRHSILQEIQRKLVYENILEWITGLCENKLSDSGKTATDNIIAFNNKNSDNLVKGKNFVMSKNTDSCRCYSIDKN